MRLCERRDDGAERVHVDGDEERQGRGRLGRRRPQRVILREAGDDLTQDGAREQAPLRRLATHALHDVALPRVHAPLRLPRAELGEERPEPVHRGRGGARQHRAPPPLGVEAQEAEIVLRARSLDGRAAEADHPAEQRVLEAQRVGALAVERCEPLLERLVERDVRQGVQVRRAEDDGRLLLRALARGEEALVALPRLALFARLHVLDAEALEARGQVAQVAHGGQGATDGGSGGRCGRPRLRLHLGGAASEAA